MCTAPYVGRPTSAAVPREQSTLLFGTEFLTGLVLANICRMAASKHPKVNPKLHPDILYVGLEIEFRFLDFQGKHFIQPFPQLPLPPTLKVMCVGLCVTRGIRLSLNWTGGLQWVDMGAGNHTRVLCKRSVFLTFLSSP